jgi:hypothetical protein
MEAPDERGGRLVAEVPRLAAHAAGGRVADYARLKREGEAPRDARFARSDHDEHPSERDVQERERELQVLLATWL